MTRKVLYLETSTGVKGHTDFPSSGVPTKVVTGSTYTVATNYQASAHLPITCDGDIYVDGDLVLF